MPSKKPQPAARQPDPPQFGATAPAARLPRSEPYPFDIQASAADCDAVAAFLGIRGLSELRLKGRLVPLDDDAWRAEARLTARAVQDCVVTLAPVNERIDDRVVRTYLPEDALSEGEEIELDMDSDDDPDTYRTDIDLSALAIESLALALDPYPRTSGAELGQNQFAAPGVEPLTDKALKPFAKLEALRAKLAGEGS